MKKTILVLLLLQMVIVFKVKGQQTSAPQQNDAIPYENISFPLKRTPEPLGGNDSNVLVETCGPFKIYYDTTGHIGFGDPVLGPGYRKILCDVLTYIDSVIQIPASSVPLEIDVKSEFNPPPAQYLAAAIPYMKTGYDPNAQTFEGGLLYDHIISGNDPDLAMHDALIKYNFNVFYTSGCSIDMYGVLLHEITHSLGIFSRVFLDTTVTPHRIVSRESNQPAGVYSIWDKYYLYVLKAGTYNKIVTGTTTSVLNPNITEADITSNKVWLTNANDHSNLPISSDSIYSSGTSLSHFNDIYDFGRCHDSPGYVPHYIINPATTQGIQRKKYTLQEIQVLKTLGYTLNPIYIYADNAFVNNHTPYVDGPLITHNIFYNQAFDETAIGLNPKLSSDTIFSCGTLTIDLGKRSELHDNDGDPIKVFPNSLFNIRGCGNAGNDHNLLNVLSGAGTNGSDKIVFTPRSNFIGRAQFGFHLYDGKDRGAFVVYTIIVKKDKNCFNNGNELIINKTFEEGTERRTDTHTTTEYEHNWAKAFLRGNLFGWMGVLWNTPHVDGGFLNYFGSGDLLSQDEFKKCMYGDAYYSISAYNFSSIPTTVDGSNRYIAFVRGESISFLLTDSVLPCNKYILSFDAASNMADTANTIQFYLANDLSSPFLPPISIKAFKIPNKNSWQHFTYSFTISSSAGVLPNYLTIKNIGGVSYIGIDNLSLIKDTSYHVTPLVAHAGNDTTIIGGTTAIIGGNPSASGGTPPYKYKWTPSANIVGPDTVANPTVRPTVKTTYVLTVTDSTGCGIATDQVIVDIQSTCGVCDVLLGVNSAFITQSDVNGQNKVYCMVNGTKIINSTVTITNSDLMILGGSGGLRIRAGGNLTLDHCHVYSCNEELWEVIEMQGGSLNVINNSLIEDGYNAVSMVGSAYSTGNTNSLNIINSIFNNNYVAVNISGYHPAAGGTSYSHINIQGSVFSCRHIALTPLSWPTKATFLNPGASRDPIKPQYINDGIYAPSAYIKGDINGPFQKNTSTGVIFNNGGNTINGTPVTYDEAQIGLTGANNFNLFDNVSCGISAVNGNISSVNNVFQNITLDNNLTSPPLSAGVAIFTSASSPIFASTPRRVRAISSGSNSNKFYDCNYAVLSSNYFDCQVNNCSFYSTQQLPVNPAAHAGKFGAFCVSKCYGNVNMSNNNFYNIEFPVSFYGDYGSYLLPNNTAGTGQYSGQVQLSNNTIQPRPAGSSWTNSYTGIGIIANNNGTSPITLAGSGVTTLSMDNNTITGAIYGIDCESWNTKTLNIGLATPNNITIAANAAFTGQRGITFINNSVLMGSNNSINNNNISGPGTTNNTIKAIYTSMCTNTSVTCNNTQNTNRGIEFNSVNFFTSFRNNNIGSLLNGVHQYGLVLDNSGIINRQGGVNHPIGGVGDPADNHWPGTWSGMTGAATGNFKTATLGLSSSQNSPMYVRLLDNPSGWAFTNGTANDRYTAANGSVHTMLLGPIPFSCPFVPFNPIILQLQLEIQLMEHISLGQLPAPVNAVTDAIYKNQLYLTLAFNTSLLVNSQVLQNFYLQNQNTTFGIINNIAQTIGTGNYTGAAAMTNTLSSQQTIAANYQLYFNRYIKLHSDTLPLGGGDSASLYALAGGCPFTDGAVVYHARTLYNTTYHTHIIFNDNCPGNNNNSRLGNATNNGASASLRLGRAEEGSFDVMLYPNPAGNTVFIAPFGITEGELAVRVTDVSGREVYKNRLQVREGNVNFNINTSDGVYIIHITNIGTNETVIKKLVIQQ